MTTEPFFGGGIDSALTSVLADVPFITVGLFSIGALTFLILLRRLDWLVLCLHFSVIIDFIASILDLSQILSRGSRATDLGKGLNTVKGLIMVREIGFSLAVGLRFLFLWGFVSEPPPGETPPAGSRMHNGSWGRWGYMGIGLKWSTLTITIAVPVLQILFRDVTILHKLGPVYEVESTIEVVLSAVFILKLLLNSWVHMLANSDANPGKRVVVLYSPMIAALLLSLWVSVGDILSFEFSETIFGRLLQAIELFIIILYTLVAAFYHLRKSSSVITPTSFIGRYTPFQGLPPLHSTGPSFRITPPMVSTPNLSFVGLASGVDKTTQRGSKENGLLRPTAPRRGSAASRISSWLNNRMSNRMVQVSSLGTDTDADDTRLWNENDAELAESPMKRAYDTESLDTPRTWTYNQSLSRAQETATWRDPTSTVILPPSGSSNDYSPAMPSRFARSPIQGIQSPQKASTSVLPKITTARSDDSGYIETPPSAYASPRSAINTVMRGAAVPRPLREPGSRTESSRISELIRQQMDLEKSIAALRLFSPDPALREGEGEEERRASASSGSQSQSQAQSRIDHSATQSEFSLSNFPEPPWGRASTSSTVTISQERSPVSGESGELGGQREGRELTPEILEPPLMPAAIDELMTSSGSRYRTGSAGTQYEITSFIGNLTSPQTDHRKDLSSSTINLPSEEEATIGRPMGISDSSWTTQTARPALTGRAAATEPASMSLGSSPLRNPTQISGHVANASSTSSASSTGSTGVSRSTSATPSGRFVRPVGLPPRPRLASRDQLSPVQEDNRMNV
ncbi:hypothetical protein B0H21DRAFT_383209 [Amylocystis lapponica]|nr:hypothetical protein B0H21DRAFT_383209 [Amylocystis lapponica]